MIKNLIKFFSIGLCFMGMPTYASMPVIDSAVLAAINLMSSTLNTSITTLNASLSQMLYQIGGAINQNGGKIASTIEAASKSNQDFQVIQQKNERVYQSEKNHEIPSSICGETASSGATQISQSSTSFKSRMRQGQGGGLKISSETIEKAVNSPAVSSDIDSARSAKIHANYCDALDFSAYGGSSACPKISSMPGADKRLDTLLLGAGENGKDADLTFSQKQIDAAHMYTQNSIRRSIGNELSKGEADSMAGTQYIGLMNQFNSILSAAAEPQETWLSNSMPNPATRPYVNEAIKSPSAHAYYKQTISDVGEKIGMSTREYERFEVGRKYSNVMYNSDLQEMSHDNLIREQIRIMALNNWLMLNIKEEIQKNNILTGQILASVARQEFEPLLKVKHTAVLGAMGGN